MTVRTRPLARLILAALLLVGALNAFGGGLYGLAGAPGVPVEWLRGSSFATYAIPSWILLVIVGGSSLIAGVGVLTSRPWSRAASTLAGIVLVTWILVQVQIIGYVSWLQPVMLAWGLVILVLSVYVRPRRDAPPRA